MILIGLCAFHPWLDYLNNCFLVDLTYSGQLVKKGEKMHFLTPPVP